MSAQELPETPAKPLGRFRRSWKKFSTTRPGLKAIFGATSLVSTDFQAFPIGTNVDGSQYFIFDYAAGHYSMPRL